MFLVGEEVKFKICILVCNGCNLEPVPIIDTVDPVEREIDFVPSKTPYDPRLMLAGFETVEGWKSGFFDKGSFTGKRK